MPNENKPDMKAMQILQTIMLAMLLGAGGWNLKTTLDNTQALTSMQAILNLRSEEMNRIATVQNEMLKELNILRRADADLDKRLAVIETKTKP